jgi:predicted DNA binding CopG/RHH family protein
MKKRGRPTKAAADRRETVIRLRLTSKEFQALSAAAKKAGLNVSDYARKKIGGYSNGKD